MYVAYANVEQNMVMRQYHMAHVIAHSRFIVVSVNGMHDSMSQSRDEEHLLAY